MKEPEAERGTESWGVYQEMGIAEDTDVHIR